MVTQQQEQTKAYVLAGIFTLSLRLIVGFLAQTCPRKQAHSGQQRIHRRKIQSFPSQLYWYQTHY